MHPYFGDSIPNSRKHKIVSNLFPELFETLSETIEFEDLCLRYWPLADPNQSFLSAHLVTKYQVQSSMCPAPRLTRQVRVLTNNVIKK